MKKVSIRALAAMCAALAAPMVLADDLQKVSDDAQVVSEDAQVVSDEAPAASNSLRAVRDKKTGELRAPNAEERKNLDAMEKAARNKKSATTAEPAELEIRTSADGMRSAILGPEYLMSLQGTRDADGAIQKSHTAEETEQPVVSDEAPTE